MPDGISERLISWYSQHGRGLPWRDRTDPYTVWISEIMLQQTRVDTVIPYFQRWMSRFPDLASLAAASEEEVLRQWEGLGYYSRARNLHKTAKIITKDYDGKFPAGRVVLQKLPGIGRYTAGAIASIAFGQDEAALDGNVRRVLARIFNVSLPARSCEAETLFWDLAGRLIPPGKAGQFNQAVMDLGATICTPRNPNCPACPVSSLCEANQLGIQEQRPVLETRQSIPHLIVTAGVIQRDGYVFLARRPPNGLLGGMWEFPGGKCEPGEGLPGCLKRELWEELGVEVQVGEAFGVYEHAYTHFSVTLHAFLCRLEKGEPQAFEASEIRWVRPEDLASLPMGKLDRQISRRILSLPGSH
ncbi:MAG: A/G-specific adenine glycosylase [Chloroflexi bacterium]|nr:A/G-specific adenine glycosylase [Chloroflexota bacterium]